MGLRFIYGRAGTGKTTFCFNEIKKSINNDKKIYIITPEQFSYTAEKKLLEVLNISSSINAEIINFKRIANRVFTEVGGLNDLIISKAGKAMLIYSILEKQKKNLKFFINSNDNIDLVLKEITELKKHNINPEKIDAEIDKVEDIVLKEKLQEINSIYKAYENNMHEKFIDEEDILTKLYYKIPSSKMFDDAIVYIDEFSGFTKQEYNIFTEILKKASQVNIIVCTDDIEKQTKKENDIFFFNKQFVKLLTNCAQNVDNKLEPPVFLDKKYKFKNRELNYLEENIYNNVYKKYPEENKNIKLFLAKTPYTEMEQVAQEINKLTREENYKYNEIVVINKNIDSIQSIAKAIFSKYNIPIFIDEKAEITENVLIKYVLSILEIFSRNWDNESVFNYIKAGFLDIKENDIYLLENYCQKMGIKRNKWYRGNWQKHEDLRKKIVSPLLQLKKEIDVEKTVKNISHKLYKYLIKNNIPEKLNDKIEKLNRIGKKELAEEYKNSLNIMIDILDEMVEFFKDEKITIDKYKEILKIGLRNKELGKIPQSIDQVIIGDIDRTRNSNIKVVFITGINDGIFPGLNKNEGFLNDKDREILKQKDLEIAKGTLDNLYEDQFNIYKAFTTAEEKLYLSYTSSNKEGIAQRPSVLISKIKKMFPKLKEESDIINKKTEITNQNATYEELLKNIRKMKNGEKIDATWIDVYNWYVQNEYWKDKLICNLTGLEDSNETENITEKNIEKLYGNHLKTSVSKLEQYRKCPFSFHLKYGLKIQEPEEYKINAIETGSFMHEVVDKFFERINNINIGEEEIELIIEEIINEKLRLEKNYIFSSSQKFIVLTKRLKKAIKESIRYIIYQMRLSDFKLAGHEVEFSKKIDNIEITGKIDRIDIGKNEKEEFIRIIDYKSSEKNINLNEVIAGTQIQLLTYIDAVSQKENKQPAGVLYFSLIEPIINESKNLSDEEIEEKIKRSFRMNGLIIADIKIIKMMDKGLEKGTSNIVPVYLDKEGKISEARSSTVTKEQFTCLQKTIRETIKQISKEILSGKIDIKPMYDRAKKVSSCKYCPYKTICAFNPNINKYEYLQNKTKAAILEEIKERKV